MSVIQAQQREVRFLKRQNLEEEAKIVGNYYADLIRMHGIDCVYHKLNTDVFGNFNGIVDRNVILAKAYGYNITPDYTCSAMMITFPEVNSDIFGLNKYGITPQAEIDFHFDSTQFACDLATKCGQLKEYPIREDDVVEEVPDPVVFEEELSEEDPERDSEEDDIGPILTSYYECGILKGCLSVQLPASYEYDTEYTLVCDAYGHNDFKIEIPKNENLYKSLQYEICNDDYLDTLIHLRFKIKKVKYGEDPDGNELSKNILEGKIFGGVLFYDLNKIGKYLDKIHPEVGDIITIDFPDDKNREQYEITDCYDKSLQSDGISPLLHKYIWKCKARRHIPSYEDSGLETNEANERMEEKLKFDQLVEESVAKKIEKYDEGDQEAYGGYDAVIQEYDQAKPIPYKQQKYDYLENGECLDVIRFKVGSRLVTDGYDLIFINSIGDGYQLTISEDLPLKRGAYFECGLRWLKATDSQVVFMNIEGESTILANDDEATEGEIQMCLNDLHEKTLDLAGDINKNYENTLKFKGSRTYLWATEDHLYAKLASNKKLYRLV